MDNQKIILNVENLNTTFISDKKEIKIVKKITENDEDYIVDITDEKDLSNLKSRFKEILEDEQKKILEN